jgi:hypothetical protein
LIRASTDSVQEDVKCRYVANGQHSANISAAQRARRPVFFLFFTGKIA